MKDRINQILSVIDKVDPDLLASVEEFDLYRELVNGAVLEGTVAEFFDNVLIMDPDVALRTNKIALVRMLQKMYQQ